MFPVVCLKKFLYMILYSLNIFYSTKTQEREREREK
jgi:hypothetical protein